MKLKLIQISSLLIFILPLLAGCSPRALSLPAPTNPVTPTSPPFGRLMLTIQPSTSFTLTSPDLLQGNLLPVEYTCDGAASTLALQWSGAPAETKSYAVMMHHVASSDDIHWYWVVYDIPAAVTSLPKNMTGIGTLGTNSVNGKTAYTPPCSKGPGPKTYTYTVYALSQEPKLDVPAAQVNRSVLLEAIQKITLASAELHVTYARK